jgi:dihydroorotate dehydrogenase
VIDWYPIARKVLFHLEPEEAHNLTLRQLDRLHDLGLLRHVVPAQVADPCEVMGLSFPNRVGLAAGLDKNAAHIDALGSLGFGFLEVGTVTPQAQPGNPRPRMFRLVRERALINRLGFNNDGLDRLLAQVCKRRWRGVLGLNIGKNATTPIESAASDYLQGLDAVHTWADYVAVNISSPNTRNLRLLQVEQALDGLLDALRARCDQLDREGGRRVPLLVKIAPDFNDDGVVAVARALLRHRIDGVVATNTTVSRALVQGAQHAEEAGGLSGAPLLEVSNRVISTLRRALGPGFAIIGVGGVLSAEDAAAKMRAGADLIQIYTGLIYSGPRLVRDAALSIRDARPTPR